MITRPKTAFQPPAFETGAITFLDVLGWKGIWQRKKDAVEDLQRIREGIESEAKNETRGKTFSLSNGVAPATKVLIVSDTIVISTNADQAYAREVLELHGGLCAKAIPDSIQKGMPLRGATNFGEFSIGIEQPIFVGRGIDEAAAWHETADWIGAFMTPSAAYLFDGAKSEYWTEYEPPLKNGIKYKAPCVNWFQPKARNRASEMRSLKKSFSLLSPIVPEVISKFENTIRYLQHLSDPKKNARHRKP